MKKIFVLIVVLILAIPTAFAQEDPVLMNMGGDTIHLSEFLHVYNKNRDNKYVENKTPEEYLDLFINFKLKVKEASALGMDTMPRFVKELAGYRRQLAQPYLTDRLVTDHLVDEAFERLEEEVRASHILIMVDQTATPADTLKAFRTAMAIYESLIKGANFEETALAKSEDPSVKDNKGDLGFFTALFMVYPFESAAYSLKVGEISKPVRTSFGYHIIKLTGRRPAQGEVLTAHIMIRMPEESDEATKAQAKQRIDEIYALLKAGEPFENLAKKYSDDQASGAVGGILRWFGTNQMVEEYERAAFALQNVGDYSEPVLTAYGWHIIKLLEKRPPQPREQREDDVRRRIEKDSRAELSKAAVVDRLKAKYNYKADDKKIRAFAKSMNENFFEKSWKNESWEKDNSMIFTMAGENFTVADFYKHVESRQGDRMLNRDMLTLTYQLFEEWSDQQVLLYEDANLEKNYPQFRLVMQEYRDGILLFEFMEKEVWKKAVKDSLGLYEFHKAHEQDYMWPQRLHAGLVTCGTEETANKAMKYLKKKKSVEFIQSKLNVDSALNFKYETGKFVKSECAFAGEEYWNTAGPFSAAIQTEKGFQFFQTIEMLPPQPKSLDEARGVITSDYQKYLEVEMIKALRLKYPVVVYKQALNQVP